MKLIANASSIPLSALNAIKSSSIFGKIVCLMQALNLSNNSVIWTVTHRLWLHIRLYFYIWHNITKTKWNGRSNWSCFGYMGCNSNSNDNNNNFVSVFAISLKTPFNIHLHLNLLMSFRICVNEPMWKSCSEDNYGVIFLFCFVISKQKKDFNHGPGFNCL